LLSCKAEAGKERSDSARHKKFKGYQREREREREGGWERTEGGSICIYM